jgi:YYY domain-containing protein
MFLRLIFWYLLLMLLGWLTFPLTFRMFSRLADRGYSFSRPLGLLLWGFVFWQSAVLGILQNQPGAVFLALVLVAALSLWAGWRQRAEILVWVRENWRLILTVELVILVGFAFMILVRGADPDATGTEKPMELAFINAILNSKTFPPQDPWLSGYAISYYHFGYILAAMLAKVTFTEGGVAFNLMLAVVFSLSAGGAYGVLYNLLAAYGKSLEERLNHLAWALLGPIFVLFVSNLEVLLEMLHQAGVGWQSGNDTSAFWNWIKIPELTVPPPAPLSLIPQRFWWWWQASRVIQDIDLLGNVSGLSPIDEFPAFSFVLGDLHPHVLVMPFVMLLIGLAVNIYLGGMDREKIEGFRLLPYRWDVFALGAVILGGISFLNTWDLPVFFALVVGAFLLRRIQVRGWDWKRLWEIFLLAFPLGVVSLLLYLPFFIGFQSQAGGILPNMLYPTRGLYLWLMFGSLFVPLFLFFIYLMRKKYRGAWGWGAGIVFGGLFVLLSLWIRLGFAWGQTEGGQFIMASQGKTGFLDFFSAALLHRLTYSAGLLTLILLLLLGFAYLVGMAARDTEDRKTVPLPMVLLMVVLGGVMVLGPEFVYLRDNFGARMNTIFKFYYQAWMLWSLAAAFAAGVLFRRGGWIARILVGVFILLGLVYPVLAFPSKTNGFQPPDGFTLDAGGYLERYQPNEAAAIAWLANAPDGVVAEAVGGQYTGYARVATLSGQPTVLGWPGHEGQWRGGYEEVGSREMDIRTLYETPQWQTAEAVIEQYSIRYIYVGALEWSTYAVNPNKFDQNLPVVFEQGGVKVYAVPQLDQEVVP